MENSDQSFPSSSSSNPLFSIFITINTLILLYFPQIFLYFTFSLVLIVTQFLLLIFLHLTSMQKPESEPTHDDPKWVQSDTEIKPEKKLGFISNQNFIDSFVEWNVRAPLEVIYEAHEGEEDEANDKNLTFGNVLKYPSLSMSYPEAESESSSDGEFGDTDDYDSPEKMCFKWDDEDRGELIEIALDDEKSSDFSFDFDFDFDEDNMIEIDVSTMS